MSINYPSSQTEFYAISENKKYILKKSEIEQDVVSICIESIPEQKTQLSLFLSVEEKKIVRVIENILSDFKTSEYQVFLSDSVTKKTFGKLFLLPQKEKQTIEDQLMRAGIAISDPFIYSVSFEDELKSFTLRVQLDSLTIFKVGY